MEENRVEIDIKKEFSQFLYDNKALGNILRNIDNKGLFQYSFGNGSKYYIFKEYINFQIQREAPNELIISVYTFAGSPEGLDYWVNLHYKWIDHLKSLGFPYEY